MPNEVAIVHPIISSDNPGENEENAKDSKQQLYLERLNKIILGVTTFCQRDPPKFIASPT
jgi:hypothetical protein